MMHLEDPSSIVAQDTGHYNPAQSSESMDAKVPSFINEKALMRKIDLRVIPVLFVIYLVAFLDRWV